MSPSRTDEDLGSAAGFEDIEAVQSRSSSTSTSQPHSIIKKSLSTDSNMSTDSSSSQGSDSDVVQIRVEIRNDLGNKV